MLAFGSKLTPLELQSEIKLLPSKNSIKQSFLDEARRSIDNDICGKIYGQIGFFNLCGYHTKEYSEITKYISKKEELTDGLLPTQKRLQEYLISLLNGNTVEMIIVVWGYKEWANFLFNNDNVKNHCQRILIVNQGRNNKSIADSPMIKNRDDFIERFQKYLKGEVKIECLDELIDYNV